MGFLELKRFQGWKETGTSGFLNAFPFDPAGEARGARRGAAGAAAPGRGGGPRAAGPGSGCWVLGAGRWGGRPRAAPLPLTSPPLLPQPQA